MEHNNGDTSSWAMQRRMEGLVNKHMADIALETLQQRLSAVSDEMNNLAEHVSRRSEDIPKDDISRRPDVNFDVESLSATFSTGGVGEKLLMPGTSSSAETAAQRKIISLLVEIKEEQQRQWAVLRELQARVQGQSFTEVEEEVEALDIDIPLRTMEQLDDTERHLEDAGAQKRMVSHLSRMGGATVDDAVRRLMQAVLSFAVGSELNWVGRGQKRSFRNTRLQGVLFRDYLMKLVETIPRLCKAVIKVASGALKRTPVGKEATHHQFADVVKKWLRYTPFRQGGSGRRLYKPPVEFLCPNECVGLPTHLPTHPQ